MPKWVTLKVSLLVEQFEQVLLLSRCGSHAYMPVLEVSLRSAFTRDEGEADKALTDARGGCKKPCRSSFSGRLWAGGDGRDSQSRW